MNAKNFYVALILIFLSPFHSAHSVILDSAILEDAITIIQEIKESFNRARNAIELICQRNLPECSPYFAQNNQSRAAKTMIVRSIFNVCNQAHSTTLMNYRTNSKSLITSVNRLPLKHKRSLLHSFDNQPKTFLTIEEDFSQELSVYLDQIKETFKSYEKNFLQRLFNNLKNICPELDPQILSE